MVLEFPGFIRNCSAYDGGYDLFLTKNVLYPMSHMARLHFMVEGVGFEPTQPLRAADLQSAPINHSGTPPRYNLIIEYLKNPAREGIRTH